MKRALIIFAFAIVSFLLFILIMRSTRDSQPEYDYSNTKPLDTLGLISIRAIMENQEFYHNKMIKTRGFLQLEFENCALYKDSSKSYYWDKHKFASIWVELSKNDSLLFSIDDVTYDITFSDFDSTYKFFNYLSKLLNGKEVEITGKYNKYITGHFDMYFGGIHQISFIKVLTFFERNPLSL